MKLSKEQIKYIDDYLKHHNIKYWDVRIELLDHIVTKVEVQMDEGKEFDKALEDVHLSFGNSLKRFWNSGIEYGIMENGIGYENLMDPKRRETNRKYRVLLWKDLKIFFAEPTNFLIVLALFFICFKVIFYADTKFAKYAMAAFVFIPALLVYIYPFKMWFQKKREKTLNLEYALFYAGFTLTLLNLFFQLFSPKGAFHLLNEIQFKWVLVICTPLFAVFNYCGFKMYKRTFDYYNNLYEKLQKL